MFRIRLQPLMLCAALLAACSGANSSTGTTPPEERATAAAPAPTTGAQPSTSATAAPNEGAQATAMPSAATAAPQESAAAGIKLQPAAEGLQRPTFVTSAGDGSGRLFVVEKAGTIAILRDGKRDPRPFLDITPLVGSSGSEQGLLGLAFHPNYAADGRLFVYYTARNGDNTLARYHVSGDPDVADPSSGTVLFAVPDPAPNHNGGMLAFGRDGYLYVGMGDGGSGGDPWGNGQNRGVLLGKLLRLDVDKGDPYGIPPDNPFAAESGARGEIWAYGLRNPWRFSFDRASGDLYIADVGQNQYEEINFQPAGEPGGRNYGWNIREATHCFREQGCQTAGLVDPVYEYDHSQGCSITGGYVYRGAAIPALRGSYVFGDYCSGTIWALSRAGGGQWQARQLAKTSLSISSFGEDEAGELYVVDLAGVLYHVAQGA